MSLGIEPTFFFLFLTWSYSLPDLEHCELTEHQEDVSTAAVAGPGGAKTNAWRNASPCSCRSCNLPGLLSCGAAHLPSCSCRAMLGAGQLPCPSHPLWELLGLGADLLSKGCRNLACLVITVLGVAFWHFSGTHPTLFKYTKIQIARQNCTVTHSWTQEKICVCQQQINVPSYLLKEASLLNSCWWPQDKLFNVYMYLSHPDLYKAVITVWNEWTNSECAILFRL